ncbi:MAG: methyltransferase domain-containing protein [Kiritimatiellae bacterium]|nr:methyltransferase domain-containing protein [Kiritimatiellia bacterium]
MPEPVKDIRASLEVGFPGGELPARYAGLRGRAWRSIGAVAEFPFEDEQFDVVLMAGSAVSRPTVREAHRVLRPAGRLYFTVPQRTKSQEGLALPDVYSLVRDGFNITEAERPPWWRFGRGVRTLSICAEKKNWRTLNNSYRPYT